ncbi:MAG TPA: GNAT family N-acetyltransferase [Gaiellaceae bacterium]
MIARRVDEIEAMRKSWQMFDLPSVHHDIDFYLAKVRSRPAIVRPHTILLEREGQPEAIAIGRLEENGLECRLGYETVYRPRVRVLVMRPGILLRTNAEGTARAIVAEIIGCLARGEADAVSFYGLNLDSHLLRAARDLPPRVCRAPFTAQEEHKTLVLSDSLDEFLASRSRHARGELRGLDRRLTRKYGERLSVKIFRAPEEIDQLFADMDRVSATTYQRALRVAFDDSEEQRETIALALDRGWFRAYVLYLDAEPIAYRSGFAYRGRFTGSKTGFDPRYRNDRVGTYLLVRLIEDLCADNAVHVLDLGYGSTDEKRRFSNASSDEAHPLVFAPTFTGVRANLSRTAVTAADKLGRRTLEQTGLIRPVTRWRQERIQRDHGAGSPGSRSHG